MKRENYVFIINYFKHTTIRENTIKFLCKFSPLLVVAIYFFNIITLFIRHDSKIILFVLIPAFDFIFVSILRKLLNKPRPYDVLNYTPLIKFTKGKGKSFPSRHTASGFIIAMACLYINVSLGIFMFALAFLIGITRIISGVHYPKDVLFGMILSILIGYIGFFSNIFQ